MPQTNRLVIVESPAKAKTIQGYLGPGWVVESSFGHIRDLPAKASEVPPSKKDRFANPLGVDPASGFEAFYRVTPDAKPKLKTLRESLAAADELYLATDEDREGESIAWHLLAELKPKVPVKRMVFHEITKAAIQRSIEDTRDLDKDLVEAQETRRIVDRLYGYPVSEVLWRKIAPKLSAGRVQSVATRLLVAREMERIAFSSAEYWDLLATLTAEGETAFEAKLVSIDGVRVATSRDFTSTAELTEKAAGNVTLVDGERARALRAGLAAAAFSVSALETKPFRRKPAAPFRTTTLQQDASRKLGFSPSRTMSVAQRLYEAGFITYMRTDSVTLSEDAIAAARSTVRQLYGERYLPAEPRLYKAKVKNAQEAHEAIRPAGEAFRTPAETGLSGDEFRLYELVWQRTLASQMVDAVGESMTVRVGARTADGETCEFTATGTVITFAGFRAVYVVASDADSGEGAALPPLRQDQPLNLQSLSAEEHRTKPPARFTEATLVSELESREIGRPSTYASIIRRIQDQGYAVKRGTALVPTWLAFGVTRLLEGHFGELVDYEFTARMEDILDQISRGEQRRDNVLSRFWNGGENFTGVWNLVSGAPEIDGKAASSFPLGEDISVRVGRYGAYVEDGEGRRGDLPPESELAPDELTVAIAREAIATREAGPRVLGTHPDTGRQIVVRVGRFGPYFSELLPEDAPKKEKPRNASLLKTMDPDAVTLEDALKMFSLPRVVGETPDGTPVLARTGPYGPYVEKGSDRRSLESEEQLFNVTMEQAEALFAQPKRRRGSPAAAPGRELGKDVNSEQMILVKDGRFGPYVTDGEYNATIPKAEDPEKLTLERATELLAERRAKGPAKKRTAKKAPVKKSGAKKTTAKKTSPKKSTARKSTAKKATAKKPASRTSAIPAEAAASTENADQ